MCLVFARMQQLKVEILSLGFLGPNWPTTADTGCHFQGPASGPCCANLQSIASPGDMQLVRTCMGSCNV